MLIKDAGGRYLTRFLALSIALSVLFYGWSFSGAPLALVAPLLARH
jgi:hypothetical protein